MIKHYDDIKKETVTWENITPGGHIYAEGNSVDFNTGDWRTDKPIFVKENCKQCLLCFPVCPDSAIPLEGDKRLDFEYDHCKGCGVCAKVCPFKAIYMVAEEE
ncbi:MAG: 4Fe-4S binding protein [Tissierellia bacterium]|nr:4Fe-4S binding protein [Tissierellia bacterium]